MKFGFVFKKFTKTRYYLTLDPFTPETYVNRMVENFGVLNM